MDKKQKLGLTIILILIGLAGIIIALNFYVRNEISTALKEEFPEEDGTYDELSVNVLTRNASVSNANFNFGKISLAAEKLQIKNLGYIDYLFNDKISIGTIEISNPEVVINKSDTVPRKEQTEVENVDFERDVSVKNLQINGGSLKITENDSVENQLYLSLVNLNVSDLLLSGQTLKNDLPFEYGGMEMESDSIFLEMNPEHDISIKNVNLNEGNLEIQGFRIIPRFPIPEFDRRIPYEKDRIELLIESVSMQDLDWDLKNDSLQITSPYTQINAADLEIYRNKLLPDDPRIKPLYSKMIREAAVKLDLDSIHVRESQITYRENTDESRPPGEVMFTEVTAGLNNITNMGMDAEDFPETNIFAEALFMDEARLTLNWEFDVSDEQDIFYASGELADISADAVNPFIQPAMNVKVEGEIEYLFYNFRGDTEKAVGDMRLKYRDFKVEILREDGQRKNRFISAIVNFFVNNDAVNDELEQEVEAEREKNRSVWNFMWKFIQNGALKSFI